MERYVGIGWLGQLGWPRFVGRLAGLVGSNLLETHKISVFANYGLISHRI